MATEDEMIALLLEDWMFVYDFDPAAITLKVWKCALACHLEVFENPPRIPDHFLSQEFLHAHVDEIGLLAKYAVYLTDEKAVAAVCQNPLALQYLGDKQHSIPFMRSVMEQNGMLLSMAPHLSDNKEIVLAAVKENGDALEYAFESFGNDKEVCLAAVRNPNNEAAMDHCDNTRFDPQVVCAALAVRGRTPIDGETCSEALDYVRGLDMAYESFCAFNLCQRRIRDRRLGIRCDHPAIVLRVRLLIKSFLSPCNKAFEEAKIAHPILAGIMVHKYEVITCLIRGEQEEYARAERARLAKRARL